MKVIFHLDLDSFFVSASLTRRPELKGKPIAVSTGQRRSILAAASYEAKDKGVYVPMPFYRAKRLVPDLVILKPNYALYTNLSAQVFELISTKYTPLIEVASIDECYIDVTDLWKKYGSPLKLAKDMQKTIKKVLKLPASIGISHNKFLAKMSSPINKPYGITITKPGTFIENFKEKDVSSFYGIGKGTTPKLEKIGIKTIGDLYHANFDELKVIFGSRTQSFIDLMNEKGDDKIDLTNNELKGISNSITFQERDLANYHEILKILKDITWLVSRRAVKRNQVGSVVQVGLKVSGGKDVRKRSHQMTLKRPVQEFEELWEHVKIIFDILWKEEPIKFVSVSLRNLCNIFESTYQTSIFDKPINETRSERVIREINAHFGSRVLVTGVEQVKSIRRQQNQSRYIESDRIIKHWDIKNKK